MTTSDQLVTFEHRGEVLIVRMNRPQKLNALNWPLLSALVDALAGREVQDAKAVVLSAEGRSFCAGEDLVETLSPGRGEPQELREALLKLQAVTRLLGAARGVSIAAVNGYAVGGGAEIALAADLVIMAPDARLRFPEVELGHAPTGGITYRLPAMVGLQRAKELLLTGRWVEAEEAVAIGLATAMDDDPEGAALSLAEKMAESPARAMTAVKKAVDLGALSAQEWALQSEVDIASWLFQSREAAASFERFREERAGRSRGGTR